MNLKINVLVFIVAFLYIFTLTSSVPPNWESHRFIEGNSQIPYRESLSNVFKIGADDLTGSHGPFNQLYYKILFDLFNYSFFMYRFVKSLFFAGFIFFLFKLCSDFMQKRFAFLTSSFVLFSFPIFIQTLVFDEAFIIGEFFKIVAIYFFFTNLKNQNSSFLSKFIIFVFAFLAIRTYTATFAISALFIIYLLLFYREKIKSYAWVILLILLTKLPRNLSSFQFGDSAYGFKLIILKKFLFNDFLKYVLSPLPVFSDLYYKPFISIFTFFGFWMFIIFIYLFIKNKTFFNNKKNISFFIIWALCELPIFFVLPEHAIRYFAAMLVPLVIIFCLFFQKISSSVNKKTLNVFFLIFILAILTNLSYVILFRATWGSAFIGMEKTGRYLLDENLKENETALLFYYATSAAPEYDVIDKKSKIYKLSNRVKTKVLDPLNFTSEFINEQKKENTQIYIVKRMSSFKNSEYPSLNFELFNNLEKIKVIEGRTNGVFDLTISFLTKLFKIPYNPNIFNIYKLK